MGLRSNIEDALLVDLCDSYSLELIQSQAMRARQRLTAAIKSNNGRQSEAFLMAARCLNAAYFALEVAIDDAEVNQARLDGNSHKGDLEFEDHELDRFILKLTKSQLTQ